MTPPFASHPDRGLADAEIHARPITPIRAPLRVRRLGFLFGQDHASAQEVRSRIDAFCAANGIAAPMAVARRVDFTTPAHDVTWEFHTEFSTVTWASRSDDWDPAPPGIGLETVEGVPVALAARIDVMTATAISDDNRAGFDERSLCYALVDQDRAQVATDFLPDRHGYTRYEVAAGALQPFFSGALIRRLLEIETYRVLALIGIGLARAEVSRLNDLETRLSATMNGIGAAVGGGTAGGPFGSAAMLDAMFALQLDTSHSIERTRYRFAASQAYGDILMRRLRDLDERNLGEHWTLQGYLRQRIEPALATFAAIERRQAALLEQTARSTALLGTRISLDIDTQNRSILGTISDTAKSQFRLQRTVEGLSTIAITYYLLGVVGYALHGVASAYDHEKAVGIAIFAPVALLAVWFYLRRVQRH